MPSRGVPRAGGVGRSASGMALETSGDIVGREVARRRHVPSLARHRPVRLQRGVAPAGQTEEWHPNTLAHRMRRPTTASRLHGWVVHALATLKRRDLARLHIGTMESVVPGPSSPPHGGRGRAPPQALLPRHRGHLLRTHLIIGAARRGSARRGSAHPTRVSPTSVYQVEVLVYGRKREAVTHVAEHQVPQGPRPRPPTGGT